MEAGNGIIKIETKILESDHFQISSQNSQISLSTSYCGTKSKAALKLFRDS